MNTTQKIVDPLSIRFVLLAISLCLFTFSSVHGQTASRPDRGFGGKGGYQTTEIDSISLQNGSLNVHVPLASLPPMAGGKLGYTLKANYNGKLWDVQRTEVHIPGPDCGDRYNTQVVTPSDGAAGWRIGGRYEIFFRWASDDFSYVQPFSDPCDGAGDNYHMNQGTGVYYKPVLRTPDGGEHELRIEGSFTLFENTNTNRGYMLGYYKWPGGTRTSPSFSEPVRFYTIDGTYLTAVYDASHSTVRWTVYQKDGTRIEQSTDGVSQRTKDSNGNSVLIGDGFARDEQTDREIKWSATTHNSQPATEVEYQSVGGGWQSVMVVWGTTVVKGKVYSKTEWAADEACYDLEPMANKTFNVVREIIYPLAGEETVARKYEFAYSSDDDEETNTPAENYCGQSVASYTRDASLGWGELSKITTPTGAEIEYGYSDVPHDVLATGIPPSSTVGGGPGVPVPGVEEALDLIVKNHVTSKSVSHDGVTEIWQYALTDFRNTFVPQSGMVTNPDGSTRTEYYFPSNTAYGLCCPGMTDGMRGQMIRSIDSNGILTERKYVALGGLQDTFGAAQNVAANTVVDTEYTTLLAEDGETRLKMTAKKFEYNYNGDLTKTIEYDWFEPVAYTDDQSEEKYEYLEIPDGIPGGATVLRVTDHTYYNSPSDSTDYQYHKRTLGSTPVVLGLPKSTVVSLNSTVKSRTEFYYDEGDATPDHGNLTETRVWDSTKGAVSNPLTTGESANYISTFAEYAANGNVIETTDAKGNPTQITYGCVDGASSCDDELENLYPTQTVSAYGTGIARTSSMKYDFFTGLPISATDEDNDVTNTTDYDILGRPIKSIAADGSPLESWTTTEYHDAARRVVVKSDLETVADGKKVAIQHFDMLGRLRLSRTLENAATEDPEDEQDGIKVETRYKITGFPCSWDAEETCSGQLVSNPFRADTSAEATGELTMGWTLSQTRNYGRYSEVEVFEGAELPEVFGGENENSTGIEKTSTDANATTVTDQAGKLRRSIANGVGQLVRVDEPNASNELGSVASPNQPTAYTYDVLNNLLTVTQAGTGTEQCGPAWVSGTCSQTRTFTYSSLSRLLTSTNPESGTFTFAYDNNGNLLTKTDARSIITTHTYDALNRVTGKDYSDSTPDLTYTYDASQVPFSKGKLTKVSSSASETQYTEYDEQDRITESKQITAGQTYTFVYTYNLDDDLMTQTYPSGKVVTFDYDASGDIEQVGKQTGNGTFVYASSFGYTPHGQIEHLRLGNGKWETTQFNSGLQIMQIGLGHSASNTAFWKVNYDYGELQTNGTVDSTKNNGNLAKQTITVPTIGAITGFAAIQGYTYDSLDRLKSATEKVGETQTWKQTFVYDRFGNKNFDTGNTTIQSTESSTGKIVNPEVLTSNNRFKEDQDNDSQADYLYDTSGNTTKNARAQEFTFNAENLQITATGSNLSMVYSYDGNNKRVKSYDAVSDKTTIFVYDANGQLSAEYTINVPPPDSPTISYLTEDALGSPRVVTNSFGEIKSRRDFLPFGEELYAGLANRATNQKYSSSTDDTRKKFATYQRDPETGLDFAQSRYYSPMQGRFTSPDEFKGGPEELFDFEDDASSNPTFYADLTIPQSLNKYQYTYNNPYKYNDSAGHCPTRFLQVTLCHPGVQQRLIIASDAITRAGASAIEKIAVAGGIIAAGLGGGGAAGDPFCKGCTSSEKMGQSLMMSKASDQPSKAEVAAPTNQTGAQTVKEAVNGAHKEVGKQKERGTGKFGSPMRGNSTKGYRLDPPNPNGKGMEKTNKHVNWWDYSKGNWNNGKGPGRKGSIFIQQ